MRQNFFSFIIVPCILFLLPFCLHSQMITGYWQGKINRQNVTLKIIQNGDSLVGTSYYYTAAGQYRRYSIKGFYDAQTNEAVWWDDALLEEKTGKAILTPGRTALLSRADFNCPGGGIMMLDGQAVDKETERPRGPVDLDKTNSSPFQDEWDFVIDNYTVGTNDPDLIDSIGAIAYQPKTEPAKTIRQEESPVFLEKPATGMVNIPPPSQPKVDAPPSVKKEIKEAPAVIPSPAIEEKFTQRKKVFVKEIPVRGDSVELRFYDNAQVDGDSISLFLNDKLIFQHIRLTDRAYTVKLSVADMLQTNELIMVAENLGSIPPNTSAMIAIVDGKRHEARLESTEGSSAMIRFVKENPSPQTGLPGQR